ncbi:MAG: M55 family metallopeptidase [Synergistales bacterium]|jgi:D-amino peptidase
MKVYISLDMEGATGIVSPEQVRPGSQEYHFGRAMQAHDLKSVLEGLREEGVTDVLVNDSHWHMTNLDIGGLPSGTRLISGSPKPLSMVEGVGGCDAAFLLCTHAMAGTEKAVLDHTLSGTTVHDVVLNGRRVGETGINAALCGFLGVPVALVTGDLAACWEAESLLGADLVTCGIKEGHGRHSAELIPPVETASLLREAARQAVRKAAEDRSPRLVLDAPFVMDLTLHRTIQADAAAFAPGSYRVNGRTLRYESPDLLDVRRWLCAALDLAGQEGF